jgi:hypothetical protein
MANVKSVPQKSPLTKGLGHVTMAAIEAAINDSTRNVSWRYGMGEYVDVGRGYTPPAGLPESPI